MDTDNISLLKKQVSGLLDKGLFASAEELVISELSSDSRNPELFLLLGDVFFTQGRSIEAQIFYEKSLEDGNTLAKNRLSDLEDLIRELKQSPRIIAEKFVKGGLSVKNLRVVIRMINETEKKIELIDCLRSEVIIDEDNWLLFWQMANEAKVYRQIEIVDDLCAKLYAFKPDFRYARELPKHARGYYAQAEQDKIIEDFFAVHLPKSKIFIEVGGFDGINYSNVRRLYEQYGWEGISIEPVEKNYKKLAASYQDTGVACLHAAVGEFDGETVLHVAEYPHLTDWGSEIATLDPANKTKWLEFQPSWHEEKITLRSMNSILEEAEINEIGFISIDTKGSELNVLKGFNLQKYRPQLILIEYGENKTGIEEYLYNAGYSNLLDNGQDLFLYSTPIAARKPTRVEPKAAAIIKNTNKIIGLVAAKNEARILARTIKSLALFVDSIIYLDDNSDDNSLKIINSLRESYKIEKIITKSVDKIDDATDRNILLSAGRELGGSHFIVIGANEVFTSNLLSDNLLHRSILDLQPGDSLSLNIIQLWKSPDNFCFDDSLGIWNYKPAIFADDGVCNYEREYCPTPRIPKNLQGTNYTVEGYNFGLMQFNNVNLENLLIRTAFDKIIEKIKYPKKSAMEIKQRYELEINESNLTLKDVPDNWYSMYEDFDKNIYTSLDEWRIAKVLNQMDNYDNDFFSDLDINDIDWNSYRSKLNIINPFIQKETVVLNIADLEDDSPQNPQLLLEYAEQYLHNKDTVNAELVLQKLLSSEPANIDALNNLAVIKIMQEEFSAAQVILNRILQINPSDEIARENLRFLVRVKNI